MNPIVYALAETPMRDTVGETFGERAGVAGSVTLLGMATIFAVLAILWGVIEALHRVLNRGGKTDTPAAKPASERWTRSPSDFFIKNTQAAPAVVPRNGIRIPRTVCICLPPGAICSFCSPPHRGIRGDFSDTGPCRRRWCSRICSRSRRWWCAPALRGSAPWMQNPRCKERA